MVSCHPFQFNVIIVTLGFMAGGGKNS